MAVDEQVLVQEKINARNLEGLNRSFHALQDRVIAQEKEMAEYRKMIVMLQSELQTFKQQTIQMINR